MRHARIGRLVCATLLAHGAPAGAQVRITNATPGTVSDTSHAVVTTIVLLEDEGAESRRKS